MANSWISHVKKFYELKRLRDPTYKYKTALKEAKISYQKAKAKTTATPKTKKVANPPQSQSTPVEFPTKKKPRCRRWCFTEHDVEKYSEYSRKFDAKKMRFLIAQVEVAPKTNKLHIQGYCEFYTPKRLTEVKKCLNSQSVHLEPAQGDADANIAYCSKKESKHPDYDTLILGEPAVAGKRYDLEAVYQMIKEGKSEYEIMDAAPKVFAKYHKAIHKMRGLYIEKNLDHWRPIDVEVFYGPTRSGKTRRCYESVANPDDVFKLTIKQSGNVWFDGYHGQKVLIIDDFYGQIKVSYLLQLLDNYKQQLEVKGSHVWAQWDKIYITSNSHPEDWYHGWAGIPEEVADAIGMRIKSITEVVRKIPKRPNRWVKKKVIKGKGGGPSITPPPRATIHSDGASGETPRHSSLFPSKQLSKNAEKTIQQAQKSGKVASTKVSCRYSSKNCAPRC